MVLPPFQPGELHRRPGDPRSGDTGGPICVDHGTPDAGAPARHSEATVSGATAGAPSAPRAAAEPAADGLVVQHVRHGYWKYPIIALVLAILLGLLGVFADSPNSPRATIAKTSHQDPGGAVLALTQELAG